MGIIFDRESRTESTFELPRKDLFLVGWKDTPTGFQAVAMTNRWRIHEGQPAESYLADPVSGSLERCVGEQPTIESPLSRDKSCQVAIRGDDLVITDVRTGAERRFHFHEDDREYLGEGCIEWLNDRYLKFNGPRLALIDTKVMKMCLPPCADGSRLASQSYVFSPDFRWVLYQSETTDGDALFLAPVESTSEQDGG